MASNTTQDHDFIREWADKRGAKPAEVASTETPDAPGILRLEFPDAPNSNDDALKEISWDDFFEKFDKSGLEFLYQEETAAGELSNFNKLIYPEPDSDAGKKLLARTARSKSAGKKAARTPSKTASKASGKTAAKPAAKKTANNRNTASAKKTAAKKTATKKTAAKKVTLKASAKKTAAKKAPAKAVAKTAPAKKTAAKKVAAKKVAAKKVAAKKTPAKKSTGRKTTR